MKRLFAALKGAFSRVVRREDGAYAVIFALSLSVLLSFTAMSVDMGLAYKTASEMQNALDAAAVAGAHMLPDTTQAQRTALAYAAANGCPGAAVSFTENYTQINLTATQDVPTTFLRILGRDEIAVKRSASARAIRRLAAAFRYRIFSGDDSHTVNMGGQFNIDGSVHSNGSLSISPGVGVLTGNAEACNSLYVNPYTTQVGGEMPGAKFIDMPDFTSAVNQIMPSSYATEVEASVVNAEWQRQTWNGSMKINGNVSVSNCVDIYGDVYINGNFQANGGAPVCRIYGNLYVNGSISFNNSVEVYGTVLAKDTIRFNGGGMIVSPSSPVCVYSKSGSIYLSMATSTSSGILYAPNGTIQVVGNTTTFYGSIVADKVTGIPANLIMGEMASPPSYLPTEQFVKLVK